MRLRERIGQLSALAMVTSGLLVIGQNGCGGPLWSSEVSEARYSSPSEPSEPSLIIPPLTSEQEETLGRLTPLCNAGDADSCSEIWQIFSKRNDNPGLALALRDACGVGTFVRTLGAATSCLHVYLALNSDKKEDEAQKVALYGCHTFGTMSPAQAREVSNEVSDKWVAGQGITDRGNYLCYMAGLAQHSQELQQQMIEDDARFEREQAQRDAQFRAQLVGQIAQGMVSIGQAIVQGEQQLAAAKQGRVLPTSGGSTTISVGGSAGNTTGSPVASSTQGRSTDASSPACNACISSPECKSQITACKGGSMKACYLGAACLCQCNLAAGGCGNHFSTLGQCVQINNAEAAKLEPAPAAPVASVAPGGAPRTAAATAGDTPPNPPAPVCLGLTQDCTYGAEPHCCAPFACICAHGYCRCRDGASVDNNGGGTDAGKPPAPPAAPAPPVAPAQGSCPPVSCVSMEAKHPKGAGHCDGELTGFITNSCSEDVYCHFEVAGSGKSPGGTKVRAGATVGGETGGIWTCHEADDQTWLFRCTTAAAKDGGCRL